MNPSPGSLERRALPELDRPTSKRVRELERIFGPRMQAPAAPTARPRPPIDDPARPWNVGLIIGPSGSGKSRAAIRLFGEDAVSESDWPKDRAIVDGFPEGMSLAGIIELLSTTGLSSPPSWLRSFAELSASERFRAQIARGLAEKREPLVVDDFAAALDRASARIAAAVLAKAVRRLHRRLVVATVREDLVRWLDPDWVYEPDAEIFAWRRLRRRPPIAIDVVAARPGAWRLFAAHHYLTAPVHPSARCFLGLVEGRAAAFVAAIPFPHPRRPGWREHRLVCLPEFQGLGIGSALSESIAHEFVASGRPYWSTTSHPGLIASRSRSGKWRLVRGPSPRRPHRLAGLAKRNPLSSFVFSFEYVGETGLSASVVDASLSAEDQIRRKPRTDEGKTVKDNRNRKIRAVSENSTPIGRGNAGLSVPKRL